MDGIDPNKVCFVIAHKYYRGYESYLSYYIEQIQKFYPNALTIVVDNNSTFVEDVFSPLKNMSNVVLLINTGSGFELGAYREGLKYIIDNSLVDQYSYFVFSQDTFILKNHYDFGQLFEKQTYALPVNSMCLGGDGLHREIGERVLNNIGLNDNWDKVDFCWANTFIVASQKVPQLYSYLKTVVQKTRPESEASERYLGRILWELNERRNCGSVDGSCIGLHNRHYDCWTVDVRVPATSYWVKRVQRKTENTRDV